MLRENLKQKGFGYFLVVAKMTKTHHKFYYENIELNLLKQNKVNLFLGFFMDFLRHNIENVISYILFTCRIE